MSTAAEAVDVHTEPYGGGRGGQANKQTICDRPIRRPTLKGTVLHTFLAGLQCSRVVLC